MIIGPRHNHIGRTPCWSATTATKGSSMRNITSHMVLCICNIVQPFIKKTSAVKCIQHTFNQHLSITCISQAFPMWTIAADASMHVDFLSMNILPVDTVKYRIRWYKSPGFIHIRIYLLYNETLCIQCYFWRYYFYFPECMPCKTRFPTLFSISFQNICIRLSKINTFLTNKPKFYAVTRFSGNCQHSPAGNHFRKNKTINRIIDLLLQFGVIHLHYLVVRSSLGI